MELSRPVLFLLLGIGIGYLCTQLVLWSIQDLNSHSDRTGRSDSLAVDLFDTVRVLCYVFTTPSNHVNGSQAVLRTWGRRCNKLIFFSSSSDPKLPGSVALPGKETRESWEKTKNALNYLYDYHLADVDWFLKANDETYVVMENLRYMLYPYSPAMPIFFETTGTVMSRAALRSFVEKSLPDPSKCNPEDTGPTTGNLKECLENVNVVAGNSEDSKGRKRMDVVEPQASSNLYQQDDLNDWFWKFLAGNTQDGIFDWSNYPVSFQNVHHSYMHCFEFMIYTLRTFGRKLEAESLPKEIITNKKEDNSEIHNPMK